MVIGGSAATIAFAFTERRFLLRTATYINYSLKREGKHPIPPNHESHSQINRPSSRQMRNWVESGNNVDEINGHGKDYIDNREFVTDHSPNKTYRDTSSQTCAPWEISPRDCRDMDTAVDLGLCNPYNSIRSEDIAQGISTKRRFVLSYIYKPLWSRSRSYLHHLSPCY